MKKILATAMVMFLLGCPSVKHEETSGKKNLGTPTYVVNVKGLVCLFCSFGVRQNIEKLSFVKAVSASADTSLAFVYVNDKRLTREEEENAIKNAVKKAGYEVQDIK